MALSYRTGAPGLAPVAGRSLAALLVLVALLAFVPLSAAGLGAGENSTTGAAADSSVANADAFVAWAREYALPFTGVDLTAPSADLALLKPTIGDGRLVLIGQANRDAHEEFALGCRLVRYLVEREGFTTLLLEENLATSARLNDYLLAGKGDPAAVLEGMGAWQTWSNEDFLALLKWLRAYNRNPAHKQKVRCYGTDVTDPYAAMADVVAYLDRVDIEYATFLRKGPVDFGYLRADSWLQLAARYSAMNQARIYFLTQYFSDLAARFDAKQSEYVAASSDEEYAWVRQEVTCAVRANDFLSVGATGTREEADNVRTTAMVDNVRWLMDGVAKGERSVLWGHNINVSRDYVDVSVPGAAGASRMYPMGKFLAADLGAKMISIGFCYGGSEYPEGRLVPPPASSIDGELARVGKPLFLVDLRVAPEIGPVRAWLESRELMLGLGGATRVIPGQAYDALVYIDRITPARLTPRALARLQALEPKFATWTIY